MISNETKIDAVAWPEAATRIVNALYRWPFPRPFPNKKIETIGELRKQTTASLLRMPNLGKRSVRVITETLAAAGLPLAEDDPALHAALRQLRADWGPWSVHNALLKLEDEERRAAAARWDRERGIDSKTPSS